MFRTFFHLSFSLNAVLDAMTVEWYENALVAFVILLLNYYYHDFIHDIRILVFFNELVPELRDELQRTDLIIG